MKRLPTLVLILTLTCGLLVAQERFDFKANYDKQEVMIPMRDGVKLFTSIYTPKSMTKARPIIMTRTPYSCSPYGPDAYRTWWGLQGNHYARQGYIIVLQDVRGRFMSEGEFVDVRPINEKPKSKKDIDETTDTYDTVEWLVRNVKGNNGRVGLHGISYPGFYSWTGTVHAHPAMKATSPQAPVSEWMGGDDWFHNGAFMLSHAFGFYARFGWPRGDKPVTQYPSRFEYPSQDGYRFYLGVGALQNFNAQYMHDSVAAWNELLQHNTWDDFWAARNVRPHLQGINIPVVVVGGWFDAENLYGALRSYESAEKQNPKNDIKLVMGPWAHGWWQSPGLDSLGDIKFGSVTTAWFTEHVMAPFFDNTLDGGPDPKLAEATVFMTGENDWRMLDAWPPKNMKTRSYYLGANGMLGTTPPSDKMSFDEYVNDPARPVPYTAKIRQWYDASYMLEDQRFASQRPDVLVYETGVLTEDVTFAGPVKVHLNASTSGTDCDWVVKVIDVFPDTTSTPRDAMRRGVLLGGYQMMVRGDVLRGKFRKSLAKPEPFKPNEMTDISYTLQDVFHRFKKGHRIMVQVQSSWFPMIDRNPGTFMDISKATDADFVRTTQRMYRGSRIEVGSYTE